MKQYLMETFRFNDWANKRMLAAAEQAPDKNVVAAIFSHLIYAQDRWLKRVKNDASESQIEWWGTPYPFEALAKRWQESLDRWIRYLEETREADLEKEIRYTAAPFDNGDSQKLRDIVLQLNYHSILHREGVALQLRDQGVEPPLVDYLYYLPPQNTAAIRIAA